jgi:hypothetical protein
MHMVVEEQVRKGDPVETKLTLARLRQQGYSRVEATRLIAAVLASEVSKVAEHDDQQVKIARETRTSLVSPFARVAC